MADVQDGHARLVAQPLDEGQDLGPPRLVEGGQRLDALARARKALADAVEAENYEEAARLRDEIRKLADAPAATGGQGSSARQGRAEG